MFTHEIARVSDKATADRMVAMLRYSMGTSYFAPEFTAAPGGGDFVVSVTSNHHHAKRELVPAILAAVLFDVATKGRTWAPARTEA